jgi:hypothetical protein
MFTGIFLFVIALFIGIFSYQRPLIHKRSYKKIPLPYWLNMFVLPAIVICGIATIVASIMKNQRIELIGTNEYYLVSVIVIFVVYAFIGNSLHTVGKILSIYIPHDKSSALYQINRIFWDKLGHYLTFLCSICVLIGISFLEINYPSDISLTKTQLYFITIIGISFGVCTMRVLQLSSYQTTAKYYKNSIIVFSSLFALQLLIITKLNMNLRHYYFNLFMLSFLASTNLAFMLRYILKITKLNRLAKNKYFKKLTLNIASMTD